MKTKGPVRDYTEQHILFSVLVGPFSLFPFVPFFLAADSESTYTPHTYIHAKEESKPAVLLTSNYMHYRKEGKQYYIYK